MPHAFRAAALAALLWTTAIVSAQEFEGERLLSPGGDIEVSVAARDGRLGYAVHYRGEEIVRPSQLGLLFQSRHGFNDEMVLLEEPERRSADTTWEQPWGENRFVRDHYNELLVTARHEVSGAAIDIRIRAFDDGIGFRYEMPEQPGIESLNIVRELTQFAVPPDAVAWWIPADRTNRYEWLYRQSGLEEIDRVHTPVTFRLPSGTHLSIHEAALVDYSAMTLLQEWTGGFRAALRPWSDGVLVKTAVPFVSPWRTIQIAPDAVGLINSSLILNLNEPNKLGDVSWVKPGKYVGIWWAMHINERTWGRDGVHGATTGETMRYMDFAAENGFVGVLVEGWNVGWDGDWQAAGDLFSFTESYPDFDIEAVTRYGHERGVELIGHHETSGNITNYEQQLGAAFDLYEELGVTRVKTGYVAGTSWLKWVDENGVPHYEYHDGQLAVRHHLKVIEEAAKRGISINPPRTGEGHGPAANLSELGHPRGRPRTGIQRLGPAAQSAGAHDDLALYPNVVRTHGLHAGHLRSDAQRTSAGAWGHAQGQSGKPRGDDAGQATGPVRHHPQPAADGRRSSRELRGAPGRVPVHPRCTGGLGRDRRAGRGGGRPCRDRAAGAGFRGLVRGCGHR